MTDDCKQTKINDWNNFLYLFYEFMSLFSWIGRMWSDCQSMSFYFWIFSYYLFSDRMKGLQKYLWKKIK